MHLTLFPEIVKFTERAGGIVLLCSMGAIRVSKPFVFLFLVTVSVFKISEAKDQLALLSLRQQGQGLFQRQVETSRDVGHTHVTYVNEGS